jgi:alkylation response protein AidB-like acyl-CoA dehydrogenase
MKSIATPLFAGDIYDTALRLAQAQAANFRSHGNNEDAWRQMLELGWQGVLVSEERGGASADLSDFAAIVEAVATQALTLPLIERCAVAPALLAASGPGVHPLLERVAAGESSIAPVLHATPQQQAALPPTLLDDDRLHGTVGAVDWTVPATHVLFDALDGAGRGPVLVLLDAAELSPRIRRYVGVDGRMSADIDVEGLRVEDPQVLLRGAEAAQAIAAAHQLGSLLGCVSAIGLCGAMIEQTVEYLSTRTQFGVTLSTFQALRHRVVDMYVAYENARGLVRDRILLHPGTPDQRQVALARLYVQGVSRTLAEATIQLHGGMGMSQEMLAARLATHALMAALRYGDKSDCLDWLVSGVVADEVAA